MDRIVVSIDANEPGVVYNVSKMLRQYLPPETRIKPDKDNWLVSVQGASLESVELAMDRYVGGFKKGHGGYRFDYKIKKECVEEKEKLRREIEGEFVGEIAGLKKRQQELEEKWGKERREYEDKIGDLGRALRAKEGDLRVAKSRHADKMEEVREECNKHLIVAGRRIDGLEDQIRGMEGEPLYRVAWQRFLRFVKQ